jgi:TolB-like protein
MSGDPEQEYFSDGISEDVITDLSKIAGLMVISRNSSFTYKGRSVDIRAVGRDLGVRSVLEGSIRRARLRKMIDLGLMVIADFVRNAFIVSQPVQGARAGSRPAPGPLPRHSVRG